MSEFNVPSLSSLEEVKEKITNEQSLMVYISTPVCGPCKMFKPIVNEAYEQENINIYHVNAHEAVDVAPEYQVTSVPTILYFKNGELVDKTIGVLNKSQLLEKYNNLL